MAWDRKFWHVRIRDKEYMMLSGGKIPRVYFHPDTPKKVIWLDPT